MADWNCLDRPLLPPETQRSKSHAAGHDDWRRLLHLPCMVPDAAAGGGNYPMALPAFAGNSAGLPAGYHANPRHAYLRRPDRDSLPYEPGFTPRTARRYFRIQAR